jgi:hypothetical protein
MPEEIIDRPLLQPLRAFLGRVLPLPPCFLFGTRAISLLDRWLSPLIMRKRRVTNAQDASFSNGYPKEPIQGPCTPELNVSSIAGTLKDCLVRTVAAALRKGDARLTLDRVREHEPTEASLAEKAADIVAGDSRWHSPAIPVSIRAEQ